MAYIPQKGKKMRYNHYGERKKAPQRKRAASVKALRRAPKKRKRAALSFFGGAAEGFFIKKFKILREKIV